VAKPSKPFTRDAELARSFAIGCGILFLLFLCGSGLIFLFWQL
jgi:hypothetical protein